VLGEAYNLPAVAVLTAHRVAQHGLDIVVTAGRQSFFDFANLGDDGVIRRCLLSWYTYSPSNQESTKRHAPWQSPHAR